MEPATHLNYSWWNSQEMQPTEKERAMEPAITIREPGDARTLMQLLHEATMDAYREAMDWAQEGDQNRYDVNIARANNFSRLTALVTNEYLMIVRKRQNSAQSEDSSEAVSPPF